MDPQYCLSEMHLFSNAWILHVCCWPCCFLLYKLLNAESVKHIPDEQEVFRHKGIELSSTPIELKSGDWPLKVVPWIGGRIISMMHHPSSMHVFFMNFYPLLILSTFFLNMICVFSFSCTYVKFSSLCLNHWFILLLSIMHLYLMEDILFHLYWEMMLKVSQCISLTKKESTKKFSHISLCWRGSSWSRKWQLNPLH